MKQTNKNTNLGMILGLVLGSGIGTSLGMTLFDNAILGMSIGIGVGMLIGLLTGAAKDQKVNAQIEAQGYIITAMKKTDKDTVIVRLANKHGDELQFEKSQADIDTETLRVGKVVYLGDDDTIELAYDDE